MSGTRAPRYRGKFASILRHPVARVLKARKLSEWVDHLSPGAVALDYGAGSRPHESLLRSRFGLYVAADYPATNSRHGERPHVFFDSRQLGFRDASFDCTLLTEVLEHVYDPRLALAELARVTKPGGHVLGTVPFAQGEHEAPFDFYRYTSFALERMFLEAGFEIVSLEPIGDLVGVAVSGFERVALIPAKALGKLGLGLVGRLYSLIVRAPEFLYLWLSESPIWPRRSRYLRSHPLGYAFVLRKP